MRSWTGAARSAAALALAFVVWGAMSVGAWALEEAKDEKAQLEVCQRDLCTLLVKRDVSGSNLQCSLQKTWASKKIKAGVEEKKLSWSLGDMRCGVKLDASRQDIVDALAKPEYELKLAKHAVKCEVEREAEVLTVNVDLAPRIQFKGGKAVKAWLGIGEIQAPAVIKGAIWTAAKLEDTFGVVHGDLIKEINEFVYERCPKHLAK
jgi:hypothetical protein